MKVRKRPIELEANRFEDGMEDGYWPKYGPLPRVIRKPAIMTLEGPIETSDNHYIVTGVLGERWPVRADVFVQTYEILGD